MSTVSTISHSGTAIVLNEGETIFVYDRGYFVREDLRDAPVEHIELANSHRAIATSCEIFEDGKYASVYANGVYYPYYSVVDGKVSFIEAPIVTEFDADAWISNFITKHEASGECYLEDWEHFSDIYKDERGVRPRFGSYKFHII